MDNLISTIETDTGVTTDHVSLIWHDQFLNPESCRKADGSAYTLENRVYIRDISSKDAQATFICDKLHRGPEQKNDLALSPVAVAFAKHEGLISPYVPTYVEQLFRFTAFYTDYYRHGAGKSHPQAEERAREGERVHFNLETKVLPDRLPPAVAGNQDVNVPAEMFNGHTVSPQVFVDTLCGAIKRNDMEARSDVQSFDFRTLILIEEQYPTIATYYLTDNPKLLSSRVCAGFAAGSRLVQRPPSRPIGRANCHFRVKGDLIGIIHRVFILQIEGICGDFCGTDLQISLADHCGFLRHLPAASKSCEFGW